MVNKRKINCVIRTFNEAEFIGQCLDTLQSQNGEFELEVINRMGYPGYFLIVSDFIKWAKNFEDIKMKSNFLCFGAVDGAIRSACASRGQPGWLKMERSIRIS